MEKNKRNNSLYYIFSSHRIKSINILIGNNSQPEPGQSQAIFKVLLAKKYNIIFSFSNNYIFSFGASSINKIVQSQLLQRLQNSFEAQMISLSEVIYENDSKKLFIYFPKIWKLYMIC